MKHVMLDLETMGISSNAAIIAIGAIAFELDGALGPSFYRVIDLESSVKNGGVIDASTVLWWMKQNDAARAQFERKGENEWDALVEFQKYMMQFQDVRVWGNGAAFDNVILSNAYKRNWLETPWKYSNDRCYRTVAGDIDKALFKELQVIPTTKHNALDDAISQVKTMQNIRNKFLHV